VKALAGTFYVPDGDFPAEMPRRPATVCGDSFYQSMVALYILCRVDSFDFGRFFDLAYMDFLLRSEMSLFGFP